MKSEEPFAQQADRLLIEKLPDGSTAVFDPGTQTVHSLNACAAAAFAACREKRDVPGIAHAMAGDLGAPVTEEIALAAISELAKAGLVLSSGMLQTASEDASRRSMLKALGTAAGFGLPVVLSLTAAEQKVYARDGGSGTTTSSTTTLP